jgi:hypothetical protein
LVSLVLIEENVALDFLELPLQLGYGRIGRSLANLFGILAIWSYDCIRLLRTLRRM